MNRLIQGNAVENRESASNQTLWNRCDVCGQFISIKDFQSGSAIRKLLTPDSDYSYEEFETLCYRHSIDLSKYQNLHYEIKRL